MIAWDEATPHAKPATDGAPVMLALVLMMLWGALVGWVGHMIFLAIR